jgi:heme oxygenase
MDNTSKVPPSITPSVATRGRQFHGNRMTQGVMETLHGAACAKEGHEDSASPTAKAVSGVVHRALRIATRDDHARIDRALLAFDLSLAHDYRIFLNIHFAALSALQADWRLQDGADFARMMRCVQDDLRILGCETTAPSTPPGTSESLSKGLGIAYVIRGSRLGAAVLRRGVIGRLPTSYLDFVPALSWRDFLTQLETIADDPNARDDAVRAARSAFNAFAGEFTRLQGVISMPLLNESSS